MYLPSSHWTNEPSAGHLDPVGCDNDVWSKYQSLASKTEDGGYFRLRILHKVAAYKPFARNHVVHKLSI